jgi:alkylation response protein AidB-like acyl-CoA dehydrogenase
MLLPDVAKGLKSVAFGLTEPDYGTGMDIGTTAVREGNNYVINGRKWLITNSDIATHFIIFAKTDPKKGVEGVSAILIERNTSGFTITPLPETMGCKGGEHGQLDLVNVRVPVTNVLGREGRGIVQMEELLEISRVFIAATSLGTAERAFELSLAFAKKRVTFGKPIANRQAIQRYLAEMGTDVYALRGMIQDAAAKWDQGRRIPAEASMCKLFGLEAVGRVTDRALLVHGGIGYTRRHPIERLYRDARLNWLEEGPPTIQYAVAAHRFLAGYDWDR